MARELKFRAWHKELSDMTVSENNEPHFHFCVATYPSMYEVMQYTGLKDKNGKEIYEGDILSGHSDGNVKVEWSSNNCGWDCIFSDEANIGLNEMCVWFGNSSEIIGNIYENPELLLPQTT